MEVSHVDGKDSGDVSWSEVSSEVVEEVCNSAEQRCPSGGPSTTRS